MKYFAALIALCLISSCQAAPPAPAASSSPTPEAQVAETQEKLPRPAPEVKTVDQDGKPLDLAALYKKGIVLVYFYPKADTPGCTAQACSLRDSYEKLTDRGITVVGASLDDANHQQAFKKKYHLPFTLVPDVDNKMVDAFSVNHIAGMANREAFLIKGGQIVWHDGSASTDKQAQDVLEIVKGWDKK